MICGFHDYVIIFLLTSSKIAIFKGLAKINTASLNSVAQRWLTPQMKGNNFLYHNKPYSLTHFVPISNFWCAHPGNNSKKWPITSWWRHMTVFSPKFQKTLFLSNRWLCGNLKSIWSSKHTFCQNIDFALNYMNSTCVVCMFQVQLINRLPFLFYKRCNPENFRESVNAGDFSKGWVN